VLLQDAAGEMPPQVPPLSLSLSLRAPHPLTHDG
jgi:hypothetical protein